MRTFTLSVSKEKYDDKNAINWDKVKYSRIDDLSLENIVELIKEGYCYTSIYKKANFSVWHKTEKNWIGSDFIMFDVDNIRNEITFEEYLNSLKYTPTIAYTTPNNNIKKPEDIKPYSRFRLLYAFDTTITNKWQYQGIYDAIKDTFDEALFDTTKNWDNCANSPVQQFSGNATKNCQITINHVIYNTSNFEIKEPTEEPIKKDGLKVRIEDEFLQNLNMLKPTDFLSCYRDKFQIIYESELEFNDDGYALTPEDYVRIQRNYTIYKDDGKICSKYKRLRDGERRRHTLFCNAKIRCQIKPQISVEELIYNLVYDRHYFYDNSDGVLSNQCLLRIAIDAKKATYQMVMKKKPLFKVDKVFCYENQIKPNALKMIVRRTLNFDKIKQWYDPTKSVKDNLKFATENNIKVGQRTLYNYCNEIGISTKGEKIEDTKIKAEICDISSAKIQGEQTHQTQQENALQRKYKPIKWAKADEYREHCKLYQLFAQRHQLMMSYSKAI